MRFETTQGTNGEARANLDDAAAWRGRRVTVMGLGRFGGGVGVTRWLAERGAHVVVTDEAPAEKLADSLKQIADLPVELRLGRHEERDFRDTEVVVVNPAVRESSPFLALARQAGVAITTEINLFVERCRAECIGVTGSIGKSTTTAMIAHVLEQTLRGRRVWLGGNIGRSLLDELPQIGAGDVCVLELSSFQLARMARVEWSPRVAVLTNLAPNHLDWHPDFDDYVRCKLNIARFQDYARDVLVVGRATRDNALVHAALATRSAVWSYGLDGDAPTAESVERASLPASPAAAADRDACPTMPTIARVTESQLRWPALRLGVPGRHNRENAAAALCVAHLYGVPGDAAREALADFDGLPHRLQRVAQRGGVTYYNDSKSTTPEAAVTAMNAVDAPLLVILGGYDKHIDLSAAARAAAQRARFAACLGQTGAGLVEAIRAAGGAAELFDSLAVAVQACQQRARPGDAVLLSPACASWDMFVDYRQRGEEFVRLVSAG